MTATVSPQTADREAAADHTRVSLLQALRHSPSAHSWERFVRLYTPLLLYWARRLGLQDHDAADLVQDVLVVLLRKLPEFQYQPGRSFRGWMRTVLMNKWRDRPHRGPAAPLDSGVQPQAPADSEALEEQVTRGQFSMTLQASWAKKKFDAAQLRNGLARLGTLLGMEIKLRFTNPKRRQLFAIFVTKEPRCFESLAQAVANRSLKADPAIVIGNRAGFELTQ